MLYEDEQRGKTRMKKDAERMKKDAERIDATKMKTIDER
jgi:hypothetical protein